jgi:hypothetical protein
MERQTACFMPLTVSRVHMDDLDQDMDDRSQTIPV